MGVPIFLQICCSVGIALLCRDMDGYPPHRTGPRGIPGPGGMATDERLLRWKLDVSGVTPWQQQQERRRDLRQWRCTSKRAECGRAVHYYAIGYGTLQGGKEEGGGTGGDMMVVNGGH